MPRPCSICTNPERASIDRALLTDTYASVADQFSVGREAARRHREGHVVPALAAANAEIRERAERHHGADLLHEADDLLTDAKRLLADAEREGDRRTAVAAVGQAAKVLRLLGELHGQLQAGATVAVIVTAEWVELRTRILDALTPFPAARLAVAHALHDAGALRSQPALPAPADARESVPDLGSAAEIEDSAPASVEVAS